MTWKFTLRLFTEPHSTVWKQRHWTRFQTWPGPPWLNVTDKSERGFLAHSGPRNEFIKKSSPQGIMNSPGQLERPQPWAPPLQYLHIRHWASNSSCKGLSRVNWYTNLQFYTFSQGKWSKTHEPTTLSSFFPWNLPIHKSTAWYFCTLEEGSCEDCSCGSSLIDSKFPEAPGLGSVTIHNQLYNSQTVKADR